MRVPLATTVRQDGQRSAYSFAHQIGRRSDVRAFVSRHFRTGATAAKGKPPSSRLRNGRCRSTWYRHQGKSAVRFISGAGPVKRFVGHCERTVGPLVGTPTAHAQRAEQFRAGGTTTWRPDTMSEGVGDGADLTRRRPAEKPSCRRNASPLTRLR